MPLHNAGLFNFRKTLWQSDSLDKSVQPSRKSDVFGAGLEKGTGLVPPWALRAAGSAVSCAR